MKITGPVSNSRTKPFWQTLELPLPLSRCDIEFYFDIRANESITGFTPFVELLPAPKHLALSAGMSYTLQFGSTGSTGSDGVAVYRDSKKKG